MRSILDALARLPRRFLVGVVRAYQLLLSPHAPRTCRYTPTCSEYAIQAFRQYGAWKGLVLTLHRLGRCHPWGGHGYDPPRWFGEDAHAGDISTTESENGAPTARHEQDVTHSS